MTPLEIGRMPPNVEKNLAQEVFRSCGVTDQSQEPAIQRHAVSCEQRAHSELIAVRDPFDQCFVEEFRASRPMRRARRPIFFGCRSSSWRHPLKSFPCPPHSVGQVSLRHIVKRVGKNIR